MRKVLLGLALVCAIAYPSLAPAIVITPISSGSDLTNAILASTPGLTISNVTYTGALGASGLFTGGTAAGLGFDSGIVLTSGAASNLNGTSNTADNKTTNNGLAGAGMLDALVPGYYTNDATILGFDFVLDSGTTAYFNYIFGSEEYDEWVGSSFNDVFGFFLDGTNIALIPGTSTAVAINNVNAGLNSGYYHDNDPSLGIPTPYAFEYDGFTSTFLASMSGLTAGQTYHIDMAIADAGDYVLDSGVFIQAGTFGTVDPTDVPEPGTFMLLGMGLLPLGLIRRRKN